MKVTLRVPITGTPTRFAQVLTRASGWTGLADVLPMGEVVRMHRQPSSMDVAIVISANAPASRPKKAAIRVVINDPNIGRQVGELMWRPKLTVRSSPATEAIDKLAGDLAQARADLNRAISSVGPLADSLRATSMVVLRPDTAAWQEPLAEATRSLAEVQAVSARLRTIGLSDNDERGNAAIEALARNRGSALRPSRRALDRITPDQGIKRAAALLRRLQLESAMGWTDALIDSRRLQRTGLAEALVVRGVILGLGRFDEEAKLSLGKASCLNPIARPPDHQSFDRVFRALGRPPACAQPLNILQAAAQKQASDYAVVVRVVIRYGPDPFGLIAGGSVRLFDDRGAVIGQQVGSLEKEGDQLLMVAEFVDDGRTTNAAGEVYVAAELEGPGRVTVATFGEPEPEKLTVVEDFSFASGGIPWWVWLIVGVAAAGGAIGAAVALTTDDDGTNTDANRGIGPINIRF